MDALRGPFAESICPLMPFSFQGHRLFQQKRSQNAYYVHSFCVNPKRWHSGWVPLWSLHLTMALLIGTQVGTGRKQEGVHLAHRLLQKLPFVLFVQYGSGNIFHISLLGTPWPLFKNKPPVLFASCAILALSARGISCITQSNNSSSYLFLSTYDVWGRSCREYKDEWV